MRCRKVSVGVFELITSFILRSSQNVIGGLQMKKYIPQMIMLLLTFFWVYGSIILIVFNWFRVTWICISKWLNMIRKYAMIS